MEMRESAVHGSLERNLQNGKMVVDSKNANQSFGQLHELFQYVFKKLKIKERNTREVLVLGFGAGSVAHILLHEMKKDCIIDGVELDKVMLEWAQTEFKKNNSVHLHHADALEFLLENSKTYDLIISDLFQDDLVPEKFYNPLYLGQVNIHRKEQGIAVLNYMPQNDSQKKILLQFAHETGAQIIHKFERNMLLVIG